MNTIKDILTKPSKLELNQLAILSGRPAFDEPLHVGQPNIGNPDKLLERIGTSLQTRRLTNDGPFCQEFEKRVADYLGVKHCIAICNATIALEIVIKALSLAGEVIVPSMTFIATAHALQWQQIRPVFCDVEPDTFNLDSSRVEESISRKTTGIIGVHLWGKPCQVESLKEIADRHGLKLIFDAAHSFGCSYKSRMIGGFGDAEVLSFHATKFFNTFEGGAVVTNQDELATKIRLMRNFGFASYDTVVTLGTNGKMNEISAAMGITGLESIEDFISVNFRNYKQYRRELAGQKGIRLLSFDEQEKNNYQYIVLLVDEALTGISRDRLMKILWAENVLARRYFYPGCHRMEPYLSLYPDSGKLLPVTENAVERSLTLPTGTAVNSEDISQICQIIRLAVRSAADIKKLMCNRTDF